MLTGKQVRVRHARNKLVPLYLPTSDANWLGVAEQLLFIYRDSVGRTRGEIGADLGNLISDGPGQLVHQGLAKLLEDRTELEIVADAPPEDVREALFLAAAQERQLAAQTRQPFPRETIVERVATQFGQPIELIERVMFADLKDEQRVQTFKDCTPSQLLERYNVALAQAVLLRSTKVEVRVWGETPARFRQLFRAIKFHRLICTVREDAGNSYTLTLDGPMSLFSSTQKYGLQLAFFLPTLLHCRAFELRAEVRWGAERKDKTFELSGTDGLRSSSPDFGTYTPKEFELFAQSFAANVSTWTLAAEPNPVRTGGELWVPDFTLTHKKTGKEVYLELFGYWRKVNLQAHAARLNTHLPGKYLIAISEQMQADDESDASFGPAIYRYKRTPSAEAIAKAAAVVAGLKSE